MKSRGMGSEPDKATRIRCAACGKTAGTLYPEERAARLGETGTKREIVCPHCGKPGVIRTVPR